MENNKSTVGINLKALRKTGQAYYKVVVCDNKIHQMKNNSTATTETFESFFQTQEIRKIMGNPINATTIATDTRELVEGSSGITVLNYLAIAFQMWESGNYVIAHQRISTALVVLDRTISQNNAARRIGENLTDIREKLIITADLVPPDSRLRLEINNLFDQINKIRPSDNRISSIQMEKIPSEKAEMSEKFPLDEYCQKLLDILITNRSSTELANLKNKISTDNRHSEATKNTLTGHFQNIYRQMEILNQAANNPIINNRQIIIAATNLGGELIRLLQLKHHPSEIHHYNTKRLARSIRQYWNSNKLTKQYLTLPMELEIACFLHDCGKLDTPTGLLDSEKKFGPEEKNQIKKHVEISEKIIKSLLREIDNLPAARLIIDAISNHHQQYDGKGYPQKGVINLNNGFYGQILAALDMLEAITSDGRTYRKQISAQSALEFMKKTAAGRKIAPIIMNLLIDAHNNGYFDNYFNNNRQEPTGREPIPFSETYSPQLLFEVSKWIEYSNINPKHTKLLCVQLRQLAAYYQNNNLEIVPEMIRDEIQIFCRKEHVDFIMIWDSIELILIQIFKYQLPTNSQNPWHKLQGWLRPDNLDSEQSLAQQVLSSQVAPDTEDNLYSPFHKP